MAAAKEISVDSAAAAVLLELAGIFILKGEQNTGLKTFFSEKQCVALLIQTFSSMAM